MKWKPGKEYRTRSGRRGRVYATDGAGTAPIHGAILLGNGWLEITWENNGHFLPDGEHGNDLMPPVREVWLWEDRDGDLRPGLRFSTISKAYEFAADVELDGRPVLFREIIEGDEE